LPKEPASIVRPAPTSTPGNKPSRILIGGRLHDPGTICGESGPQVQYFYLAGEVVRVHASCDVTWKLERARPG
jgi:hypothetical protein